MFQYILWHYLNFQPQRGVQVQILKGQIKMWPYNFWRIHQLHETVLRKKVVDLNIFFSKIRWAKHGVSYTPWGQGPGVMALIFAVFDSWGLFTQNIFPEKKILWKAVPCGTVRFAKYIFFTLNSNISWFLNDRSKIFSVIKNGFEVLPLWFSKN